MEITSDLLKRPWTPFRICLPDRRDPKSEIYLNSRYQVHLQRHPSEKEGMPDLVHLSFKRRDQYIPVPYQDKLRIKDELVHPGCEGVELLPARSREVDLANQYHLWIVDSVHFRFPLDTHMFYQMADPLPSSVGESDLLKKLWTPLLPSERLEGGIVYRNSQYQAYLQRFSSQGSGPDAWSEPLRPVHSSSLSLLTMLGSEFEFVDPLSG